VEPFGTGSGPRSKKRSKNRSRKRRTERRSKKRARKRSEEMKVLVVGGTQFNGLALVRELVRRGHEVTTLNRGQTEAKLPRSVRRLYCDRTDAAKLREVLGTEEWDCVQDISGYRPEDVELMVDILRGRVGH
jgi:2'-hydroxyisoflavone reductase